MNQIHSPQPRFGFIGPAIGGILLSIALYIAFSVLRGAIVFLYKLTH